MEPADLGEYFDYGVFVCESSGVLGGVFRGCYGTVGEEESLMGLLLLGPTLVDEFACLQG